MKRTDLCPPLGRCQPQVRSADGSIKTEETVMLGKENAMTIRIQMPYEVAKSAKQAIADDCAEQLAKRKAAGESDTTMVCLKLLTLNAVAASV